MEPFTHRLRVRYAECDPQGVVYFARYPMLFDVALTELWRERIGPYGEMVEAGSDMVVAEMTVRYRAPALFDEDLDITVGVERLGETSVTLGFSIARGADTLVEGSIRQVCIDPATKAKKPLPPDVRAALA